MLEVDPRRTPARAEATPSRQGLPRALQVSYEQVILSPLGPACALNRDLDVRRLSAGGASFAELVPVELRCFVLYPHNCVFSFCRLLFLRTFPFPANLLRTSRSSARYDRRQSAIYFGRLYLMATSERSYREPYLAIISASCSKPSFS
jgi:hypothetical protein